MQVRIFEGSAANVEKGINEWVEEHRAKGLQIQLANMTPFQPVATAEGVVHSVFFMVADPVPAAARNLQIPRNGA